MAKPWKLRAEQSAKDRLWYVKLRGGNGETVLRSKGIRLLAAAEAMCRDIQSAEITVLPDSVTELIATNVLKPHKGTDGLWYNRLTLAGRETLWSEGYVRSDAAQRACRKTRDALVVILEPLAAPLPKTQPSAD